MITEHGYFESIEIQTALSKKYSSLIKKESVILW